MKKTSLHYSAEELFDKIDWEKVNAKIQEFKLLSWEYEDVANLVVTAFNRYAPKDFSTFSTVHVERQFIYEAPEFGSSPFIQYNTDISELVGIDVGRCVKGYIDIHAYEMGNGFNNTEKGVMQSVVIDWKTASNLDAVWRNRQVDSWQGKLYARVTGAKRVEFRGIQKDGRSAAIGYEWPTEAYNNGDVDNYILQAVAMREPLLKSEVWPKRMPFACEAYGRKCPYHKLCREEIGDQHQKLIAIKPFSYSGIDTFLLCPERYRLDAIFDDSDDEGSSAGFGKAFHTGIAEAYEQLFNGTSK